MGLYSTEEELMKIKDSLETIEYVLKSALYRLTASKKGLLTINEAVMLYDLDSNKFQNMINNREFPYFTFCGKVYVDSGDVEDFIRYEYHITKSVTNRCESQRRFERERAELERELEELEY